MKSLKFGMLVVVVVSLFYFFAVSTTNDGRTSTHERPAPELTAGANQLKLDDYSPREQSPSTPEFGIWRNQIFVNYTSKQLMYFTCEFTEDGALSSCTQKFVDTVMTPDPSLLPADTVVGMVSRIYPGENGCTRILTPSCVFFKPSNNVTEVAKFKVIWWVDENLVKSEWYTVLIRQESMNKLLGLIGPEALADAAVGGGVQVFLIRGDGNPSVQMGVAVGNSAD